jgi:hypothetical protein
MPQDDYHKMVAEKIAESVVNFEKNGSVLREDRSAPLGGESRSSSVPTASSSVNSRKDIPAAITAATFGEILLRNLIKLMPAMSTAQHSYNDGRFKSIMQP